MNGREYLQLLRLAPGVVANTLNVSNPQLATNMQSVNGVRSGSNHFLLDGSENMNNGANSNTIVDPNVDAISEVKMDTASYPAEFGGRAGTIVNVVTKSGTRDFHGTLFEFVRNNDFDVLQVALSVPLLVATGLFMRTLSNLLTVDPGFGADHLLQVTLDTRGAGYRTGQVGSLYRDLLARVGALPGVAAVTGVRNGLLTGGTTTGSMSLPGRGIDEVTFERADVGPQFFRTMAIPVVAGRDFTVVDTSPSPRKIAISESFARRYVAGRHPIGERIGGHNELEVVAVVKDLRFSGLRQSPEPMLYFAALQAEPDRLSALEVRTVSDPTMLANAVRREIENINRRLLVEVKTMQRQRQDSLAPERLLAFVAGGFGALGLILVCVGLYGVISRAAVQRSSEFGLRIALGSSPAGVLGLVIQDTVRPVLAGLLLGIGTSWAVARILQSKVSELLYGLTVTDAPTILVAIAVILTAAGLAALIPAARAARSDPLITLRQD